jgi:LPS sulfotransferase NodH
METFPTTQHLLLCATHRTGSNVLDQYLKASQLAGRPREYYSHDLAVRFAQRKELPNPALGFMAYQRAIMERWTTPNGTFAAKIMWRHVQAIHDAVAADPAGAAVLGKTAWDTVQALHPAPMLVHVTRRNKVRQAISMVRAKQTGVYTTVHLDKGVKQIAGELEYDFHHLRFHLEKFEKEDANWVKLFREHGLRVHTVVFEDFIKDPQAQTIDLLKTFGLPEPNEWHWPAILIRPQSDPTSAEWEQRYLEDLKSAKPSKNLYRERRHRALKALERQAAREARWQRWESNAIGRTLVSLQKWWRRNDPVVRPEDARGDGVTRPTDA